MNRYLQKISFLFVLATSCFLNFKSIHAQTAISYSNFIGNESFNFIKTIKADGVIHILGQEQYGTLPTTTGTTYNFAGDMYYAQFDAETKELILATYLGGNDEDAPYDFNVDGSFVNIIGYTSSSDIPVTNGSSLNGPSDLVFFRLNKSTGAITTATYLGGSSDEFYPTAFQMLGNQAHVLISTFSYDFPVTTGSYPTTFTNHKVYVRLDATNGDILTAKYLLDLSSSEFENNKDIIEVVGNKVHLLSRATEDFTTTDATIPQNGGIGYKQLDRVSGDELLSTTFGGEFSSFNSSNINAAVFKNNKFFLVGTTGHNSYPSTTGASINRGSGSGAKDIFYTVLSAANGSVLFSTFYGGSSNEFNPVFTFDNTDNTIYLSAYTHSNDIPTTDGSTNTGNPGIILYKINALSGIVNSSKYIPANGISVVSDIGYNCSDVYLFGITGAPNFPFLPSNLAATTNKVFMLRTDQNLVLKSGNFVGNSVIPFSGAEYINAHIENDNVDLFTFGGTEVPVTVTDVDGGIPTALNWANIDLCPENFLIPTDTLSPSIQNVCSMGFIKAFNGVTISIPSDSLATLYIDGTPSDQDPIFPTYQWQVSNSATGPWTNLAGAITKNYQPIPVSSTKFFRRLALKNCCGVVDTVSISSVAQVAVSSDNAPEINGGTNLRTCPSFPVTIGGSPTVTGGVSPYTYQWTAGSDTTVFSTVSNPTVSPNSSIIYTLKVTDAIGCSQIGQSQVTVYRAQAGADLPSCGNDSTKILSTAIPGLSGVSYSWSPSSGLSCTTCIQPKVRVTTPTNYIYTITVPVNDSVTCTTSDTVRINPVRSPSITSIAGADVVVCAGSSALLGSSADFFNIPIQAVSQSSGVTVATVANLTDANFSTGGLTNNSTNQWIRFDLGSVFNNISTIRLSALSSTANLVSRIIQYSNDGISWQNLSTITSASTSTLINYSANNISARYIRVFRNGTGIVGVGEIRVLQTFNYTWTPSLNLSTNTQPQTTFNSNATNFPPSLGNPMQYILNASLDGCIYRDTVLAEVIKADAGLDGCGPRVVGGNTNDPRIGETFLWEKISGGGTILGSDTTANTTVSASPTGDPTTYRLTTTYKGVTCTDEVVVPDCGCVVDIDVNSKVSCPSNKLTTDVQLIASASGLGDSLSYSWTPMVGLNNYNTKTVTLTDTVQRTYTVTVRSKIDTSLSCTGTILVNKDSWLLPTFNAPDKVICPGNSVNLGLPSVSGYTYSWTPASQLVDPFISNPTTNDLYSTLTFTATVTDTASGCSVRDDSKVTVRPVSVNAGPDHYVCINAIITLGMGDSLPNYTYKWLPSAPWQNGTDSSYAKPDVLVATNLTFTLESTDLLSGCSLTDEVDVFVTSSPTIVDAPDVNLCLGSNIQIGSPALPGVRYRWTPTTGLSDPNIAQPTANPSTSTTYTVTATFPGACDSVQYDVTVTVIDPSFTLTDFNYCPSDGPIALGASAPSGMASYNWTPAFLVDDPTASNPNSQNPPPSVVTNLILRVTDANGCIARDTLTITPDLSAPLAGANKTICLGESIALGSSANEVNPDIEYSWSPSAGLSCTTCTEPIFTSTSAGTFNFTLTKTNISSGCSSTDEVVVNVLSFELPALPNPTVCQNSCVNIGTTAQAGVSYFWTPSSGLSSDAISNPLACVGTSSTSYTLTAVSPQGCVDQKTIAVNVSSTASPVINMVDTIIVTEVPIALNFNPTVTPSATYSYLWTPNDGSFSNNTILNPLVNINSAPRNYTLQVTNTSNGCQASKSIVVLYDFAPLPVTLVRFDAALINDKVFVNWQTASEFNNNYFEIQRSKDGIDWEKIGQVAGNGTTTLPSNYQFIDRYPLAGISYYRYRQVDFDGKFEFSPIRSVENNKEVASPKVEWYPNPSNGTLTVKSTTELKTILLMDMFGRPVQSIAIPTSDFTQLISFENLVKGTYLIQFIGENFIQTDRIIIQ